MALDKQRVIEFIRRRGDAGRVDEAERLLPDELEMPRDEVLLAELGVRPDDLEDTPAGAADRARPQPNVDEPQPGAEA